MSARIWQAVRFLTHHESGDLALFDEPGILPGRSY
jgi:hypothetical protein